MSFPRAGRPAVPEAAKFAWAAVRPLIAINALARHLGVSPAAVSKWPHVPEERLADVANFTGLSPNELRPDLNADPWAKLS